MIALVVDPDLERRLDERPEAVGPPRCRAGERWGKWGAAGGSGIASRTPLVPSLVDCLIAAVALRVGLPILAADRDFEVIARHTGLELVRP